MAGTDCHTFAVYDTFVTGGKFQFLPRGDKYFFDRKMFQRPNKTESSARTPHGINDTGLP
jgi:hypothetical protein